jgi:hypothetical protein
MVFWEGEGDYDYERANKPPGITVCEKKGGAALCLAARRGAELNFAPGFLDCYA